MATRLNAYGNATEIGASDPGSSLKAVTPHATDPLPGGVARSLWVIVAGDLVVRCENDTVDTPAIPVALGLFPFRVTHVRSSSTATVAAGAGNLSAPTGLAAVAETAGTVSLSWNAVTNATGYIVYLAYNDPATWPTNDYLELDNDGGAAVLAGDMIIFRVPLLKIPYQAVCNRVWTAESAWLGAIPSGVFEPAATLYHGYAGYPGSPRSWELKKWSIDVPKPSAELGDYYLERKVQPGQSFSDGVYWSGGSGQTFYYVMKDGDLFKFKSWMWASEARSANFTSALPGESSQTFTLPTSWTEKSFQKLWSGASPSGGGAYRWQLWGDAGASELTIRMAGMKCWLDNDGEYGDMLPDLAAAVIPGQLHRHHDFIKTQGQTYNAEALLAPAGEGPVAGASLPMLFDLDEANGLIPWFQVEWALSKPDHIAVATWLGAQAHRFPVIHGEYGNEPWNFTPRFWPFPPMYESGNPGVTYTSGQVAGLYNKMIYEWIKLAPNWNLLEPKLRLHICGHSMTDFGAAAYQYFTEAKHVDIAQYNGGWDTGTALAYENGDTFRNMLIDAPGPQTNNYIARDAGLDTVAALVGKTVGLDVFHDIYEAGPGYQLNGLNGLSGINRQLYIVQEVVKKSRASAMAQLDSILTAAARGYLSNYFTLNFGDLWKSHREDGGAFLIWTVGNIIPASLGEFYVHEVEPITDPQTSGHSGIKVYALQSVDTPDKWVYAILNRKPDRTVLTSTYYKSDAEPSVVDPLYSATETGMTSITIATPHQSATGCRVMTAGIGNMREHDRYAAGYRLTPSETYEADSLCVSFDTEWETKAVPNVSRIPINAALGAEAGGLRGGNFLLIELTGVSS